MRIRFGCSILSFVASIAWMNHQAEAEETPVDKQFSQSILPFLTKYCCDCHDEKTQEAKLDLSIYKATGDVTRALPLWEHVLSRVKGSEMPPVDSEPQPSAEERLNFVNWIRAIRRQEAMRNAGDPGVVLVRRLSNAEYNYSIRDLTGVDINPTRDFPVDPANEAGFDNSGESLSMSPALLKKYLEAARLVSEHLVLKPHGFSFALHPVVTETDRDKYCVKRIVQFYAKQPTDLSDYLLAAWRFRQRESIGKRELPLSEMATEAGVSPKYLSMVWESLTDTQDASGPLAHLQSMWNKLPSDLSQEIEAKSGCNAMRDFVVAVRRKLEPAVDNLDLKGIHKGSQPFVLWKNDQYASYRRSFSRKALVNESDAGEKKEGQTLSDHVELALMVPAEVSRRAQYDASLTRFCSVFPDAFYISERGRDYEGKPKEQQEKGRLLSAGFHSMMGYYRDDAPLCDMILSDAEKQEIDDLWRELDFVTAAPMRQYAGFVWFERTDSAYMRDEEFDFARAEDKSVTTEEMIRKLAATYVAKAKRTMSEGVPIQALESYFERMNDQIRWIEKARLVAEPSHIESLVSFASKAWRRSLTQEDQEQIQAFYRSLRMTEGLSHEDAIQDSLVAILMSPHFCYRSDCAVAGTARTVAGTARRPLTDTELASRLSFFLWSSVPDETLLERAAAGELHNHDTMVSEARRMLQDPRSRSLATDFAGNWLDFRRFEEHNSVDRNRFPGFTDALRQAMFEEPVRFCMDVIQNDSSVLDFMEAKHTFVNADLARHYGIPTSKDIPVDKWIRIDDASPYGRGGLLPMSVFLTKNAPGLRTSPVKRGYWVVRRLLGETIPPPPPNVPELPSDESQLGEKSLRETLAMHRDHAACAGCHNRIDSIGLVFENYGPVGERREIDLGGRAVDTWATFPDGSQGQGIDGLRNYLKQSRQQEFVDNLCRKLLCFSLGRSLVLSDDPLIEQMQSRLTSEDYRFSVLIETIVTSPQFLEKRGDSTPENPPISSNP
ncbi:MAG: DUF1592 domain-containing protein [Planctomycetota bacterium]|nr:DUF1592 domain-containing protein [Planctomycetota bacterium]